MQSIKLLLLAFSLIDSLGRLVLNPLQPPIFYAELSKCKPALTFRTGPLMVLLVYTALQDCSQDHPGIHNLDRLSYFDVPKWENCLVHEYMKASKVVGMDPVRKHPNE